MDVTNQQQQPAHEAIARRAYRLWKQHGGTQGNNIEFWLKQARQVCSEGSACAEPFAGPDQGP